MEATTNQLTYSVPGVSCEHCRTAITSEVTKLEGVKAVGVDLEDKKVTVVGSDLDDSAVRAAIDEAGYDVA
jgi:copper ion binding protein